MTHERTDCFGRFLFMILALVLAFVPSCTPVDPRDAVMAVHGGARWVSVPRSRRTTMTVFRENPPLTGLIGLTAPQSSDRSRAREHPLGGARACGGGTQTVFFFPQAC